PGGSVLSRGAVLLAETLHPAGRVDQLLLARVERVAVGADIRGDLALGGTSRESVATGAFHHGRGVYGMDVFLHRCLEFELACKYIGFRPQDTSCLQFGAFDSPRPQPITWTQPPPSPERVARMIRLAPPTHPRVFSCFLLP